MNEIAIIIQGPLIIDDLYQKQVNILPKQLESFCDFPKQIIFSTWEHYKQENLPVDEFNFIFNEPPPEHGQLNLWLQKKSTIEGLKRAKDLNFKYALKLRSDMVLSNPGRFFSLMNLEKLNFLCWNHHQSYVGLPGYLTDFIMFGEIDEMIKLWEIEEDFANGPEIMMTENLIKNCNSDIEYFLNKLSEDCDLFWVKNQFNFSIFPLNKPKPTVCNKPWYVFSETKEYLNKNYLNCFNR
jgi:hypothetical protein